MDYKNGVRSRTSRLNFDLPVKGRLLFEIVSSVTSPKKVSVGGSVVSAGISMRGQAT